MFLNSDQTPPQQLPKSSWRSCHPHSARWARAQRAESFGASQFSAKCSLQSYQGEYDGNCEKTSR